MSDTLTIRPAEPKDYPNILRLNEANVSVLAPMDEQIIHRFAEWTELFWAVEADGAFAAFLIALCEGVADYWSENYKWFSAHYPRFLYVDRIVIDEAYRPALRDSGGGSTSWPPPMPAAPTSP